ncbi:MAG: hypothetical protein FWG39_01650 [Alphaproteobacteria bacterium]|nr:hypothetical protein [Alphaproteobacteria bacterium]
MKKTLIITGAMLAVMSTANAQLAERPTATTAAAVSSGASAATKGDCNQRIDALKNSKSSLRNFTAVCSVGSNGSVTEEWSGVDMQNIGQVIVDIIGPIDSRVKATLETDVDIPK